jgi:NlpC/P60 family
VRFNPKHVCLLLLCAFASDKSSAQRTVLNRGNQAATSRTVPEIANRHENPATARLLSLDDGLSILGAALESRVHLIAKSDCSHLVHAVYERAGFPYRYVSSSDLYIGVNEFRRVTRTQPGDLVVWPGHVGIAISPGQHSFYSVLHSGLGVETYDAPYWRARGRPRFYRYFKGAPATVKAAIPGLTPTTLGSAESHDEPAVGSPRFDPQETTRAKTQSHVAHAEVQPANLPITSVVKSVQPRADEITEALSQAFNDTGEALHGKDLFLLPQPLVVFDKLEIEGVSIERGHGWVAVRIQRPLSVTGGQVKQTVREERQRWLLLRRDENTWEVVLPQGAIYLPRDAAVRVLARQLAVLTDNREMPSLREKAQIARLLSTLLREP